VVPVALSAIAARANLSDGQVCQWATASPARDRPSAARPSRFDDLSVSAQRGIDDDPPKNFPHASIRTGGACSDWSYACSVRWLRRRRGTGNVSALAQAIARASMNRRRSDDDDNQDCLDWRKSARVARVGRCRPWLPDPSPTRQRSLPIAQTELRRRSVAHCCSPLAPSRRSRRAAFLLHDVSTSSFPGWPRTGSGRDACPSAGRAPRPNHVARGAAGCAFRLESRRVVGGPRAGALCPLSSALAFRTRRF